MKTDIEQQHREAMRLAHEADLAKHAGQPSEARLLLRQAMELERTAALSYRELTDAKPATVAILLRSAASLAWECGDWQAAEKLVGLGLFSDPPPSVAQELRDLNEQINFTRHLEVRGVELTENDLQLSLAGPGVNFGMIEGDDFFHRGEALKGLLYRTAERQSGMPYRQRGEVPNSIRENLTVYLSTPRAASFAITYRLGTPSAQLVLDGMIEPPSLRVSDILDDLWTNLTLFEEGRDDELRDRMSEEYRNDFLRLAKRLAPDGERVKLVGLTGIQREASAPPLRTLAIHRATVHKPRTQIPALLRYEGRLIKLHERTEGEVDAIVVKAGEESITALIPDSRTVAEHYKQNVILWTNRRQGKLWVERIERAGATENE